MRQPTLSPIPQIPRNSCGFAKPQGHFTWVCFRVGPPAVVDILYPVKKKDISVKGLAVPKKRKNRKCDFMKAILCINSY